MSYLVKVATARPRWESNPQPKDWEPNTLTSVPNCSALLSHTYTHTHNICTLVPYDFLPSSNKTSFVSKAIEQMGFLH